MKKEEFTMGKLDGKVCIITGCASGLGKQEAIRFAEEGAKLAICSRTAAKLEDTKRLCEERGAEVLAFPAMYPLPSSALHSLMRSLKNTARSTFW